MNKEPLVLQRRDVHRTVARRPDAKAPVGWIELGGAWSVRPSGDSSAEKVLAADAEDFLKRMGVTVQPDASKQILLEVGSSQAGFRTVVASDRIDVHGADASSLWSGWVHLENEMREAGGPVCAFCPGTRPAIEVTACGQRYSRRPPCP